MNWLDIVIVVILGLASIRGYRTGFVVQIATLGGLIVSIIVAGKAALLVAPELNKIADIPPSLLYPTSYTISFIFIFLAFVFVGKATESLFKIVQLNFINKLSGAVFSFIKGTVIISIALLLITTIDQPRILLKQSTRESSLLYTPMLHVGEALVPVLKTQSEYFLTSKD